MPEADPTRRFTERADAYVRARPSYPREVLAELARAIGFTPDWIVADVGSGTGISTRLFLDHGNTVYAVEPNESMRRAAESALGSDARFHSIAGSASATGLAADSIDLIVVAQALHWFEPRSVVPEFARIARAPSARSAGAHGSLCVLWNERRTSGSPFAVGYEELLLRRGTDYRRIQATNLTPERVAPYFHGARAHHTTFPYSQELDLAGVRSRLMSSSYVPLAGEPGHDEMWTELDELFARNARDGRVVIEYDTHLYCGAVARNG